MLSAPFGDGLDVCKTSKQTADACPLAAFSHTKCRKRQNKRPHFALQNATFHKAFGLQAVTRAEHYAAQTQPYAMLFLHHLGGLRAVLDDEQACGRNVVDAEAGGGSRVNLDAVNGVDVDNAV